MPTVFKCAVVTCKENCPAALYFPFPNRKKSLDRYRNWVLATGNPELKQYEHCDMPKRFRICSKHFENKEILRYRKYRTVANHSVPSLHLPVPLKPSAVQIDLPNEEIRIGAHQSVSLNIDLPRSDLRAADTIVSNKGKDIESAQDFSVPDSIFQVSSLPSTKNSLSGLSCIECNNDNDPFQLCIQWLDEAANALKLKTILMNIATASMIGDVANKSVALLEINNEKFIFITDINSIESTHLFENPKISACFSFTYQLGCQKTTREIRIRGGGQQLSKDDSKKYYNVQPLSCKIQPYISTARKPVIWKDLKNKHDEIFHNILESKTVLEMPANVIGFEIIPSSMEFYYYSNNNIGDTVLFTKNNENEWQWKRIAS